MTKAKDPGAGLDAAAAHAARLKDPKWHVKTAKEKKDAKARRYAAWLAQSGGAP